MTWIKICGITSMEDACLAQEAGANALGFILVPESPRYIDDPPLVEQICKRMLGRGVSCIGVVRDGADVDPNARLTSVLTYFQAYEDSRTVKNFGDDIVQVAAFRVKDRGIVDEVANHKVGKNPPFILLDAYHPDRLGGSGSTFDWQFAREVREKYPERQIILAGGLTPQNVQGALSIVRPFGVDVSSGVESNPGKKDPDKVRRFIEAVREFDRLNAG